MRSLLDVNVLIALLDSGHTEHVRALEWFVDHAKQGWASCPLTQNGCVRILSQPAYANALPFREVECRLRDFAGNASHSFWPDDISILDPERFDLSQSLGPRQLTDVYLLALAVRNNGRLVTFDQKISLKAVPDATPDHLLIL